MKRDGRHFMASVKIGPKGQIVIPKEARDMFGLESGDILVLLADSKRGIALQTMDKLNPMLRKVFDDLTPEEGSE
jgi:AbrB family looped-hinge helix DNA binding protein